MKLLKMKCSPSQIKALLRKDFLVRFRAPWMSLVQLFWPCMIFMLPYLIRLKYGPEPIEDCQFPARLLPTKNNVLHGFYSYICSIENKCTSTKNYEEYMKMENAPMKPIIDIVNIFITNDQMFNSLVELPEKANFISAVTTLVTSGHMDEIRKNVEKVIDLVPQVEQFLNGSFDIKRLFSDRKTFVKGGYLLCGHPFPNTDSIPLVNDILYSEDFSEINDDELKAMPTKYCKRLYLDVTSSNHGKLTWNTLKPIIHGKILYAPNTEDTQSIMKFSNSTFEELNRLKMASVAVQQILIKLREDEAFQKSFDSIIRLAQTPFVRSIIGDEVNIDQIESVIQRIRTDPIIFDVINTIKNILECFSVDRFVPINTQSELRKMAYELNQQRLFYAAVYFNSTDGDVSYKFHMDTDNTQPTIENHNRFWFPGPSRSMIRDMKYHRGFVQIKQALDMGIIKHKKYELKELGLIPERPSEITQNGLQVHVDIDGTGSRSDNIDNDDDDDDDWFTSSEQEDIANKTESGSGEESLLSSLLNNLNNTDSSRNKSQVTIQLEDNEEELINETTTISPEIDMAADALLGDVGTDIDSDILSRSKRQGLFDLFLGNSEKSSEYEVDNLKFYTKQFPYPSYVHDDFKTGIYLAQAVQVAFLLGLVVEIASCVRHRIWMRESRNSMIMRSMGLKPCSEMTAWIVITFLELLIIFILVSVILYAGGMVAYTRWLFTMYFLVIFGACLIAFCYMCSTFFTSATIGAVATALLYFISFCPYIIVLLFDAKLSSLQNFGINLSFTTAFAQAWSQIMRMELQEVGLSFDDVFREGMRGEFGFGVFMLILDMFLYILVGYINQRFKNDEYRFVEVQREELDANMGATMTNVSKTYDGNKVAVSNVNLSFPRNQVTCLLGRNGAGKSTLIKMLTGQVVQTTGRVILSQNMTASCSDNFDKIGVCSQDNILIPNLTAREHLEMYAKIKLKHGYKSEVDKTLKSLNFGKHENYKADQLSGGFQRRLCVAIAFIGSPNVVILDEPCNGVDSKARKDIWELIERLRKGRAVVFATHFLDEAEHLSDIIVIMKNGSIIAKHNPETLKKLCTSKHEITLQCLQTQTAENIRNSASKLLNNFGMLEQSNSALIQLEIPYEQNSNNCAEFLKYLEDLQQQELISNLCIESQNLEQLFKELDDVTVPNKLSNGHPIDNLNNIELGKTEYGMDEVRETPLTRFEAAKQLFWKRLRHFSRNYRMLLCVIVLPAIFELLAMWFVAYRLEDDFDKTISLSRDLYPETTQMLSMEIPKNFTLDVYDSMQEECSADMPCRNFPNSERAFYWILETLHEYHGKRYGGYTFNDTRTMVWYNNKGYHAMMAWLNDLNTHLFQTEMNATNYSITSYNEPWKLGFRELSTSSILRQAGDSCMVFILLIAFSLVVAVASVYLVRERVNGEKLQQKLCGVDASTYWSVAFIWDFVILILAILVCTSIILAFNMPIFVDRQQLSGIIVLSLFFGFACIPGVHVFEKLFSDSSVAIVTIFCMNLIIPLFTMAIIVLLGVIGDSSTWDDWRYFLNRAFLIFPQHALGDGLLEICKNYMAAQMFIRYDIDSYKKPLRSDLLAPHLIALSVLGVFFISLNVILESGLLYKWRARLFERFHWLHRNDKKHLEELKIISIQNSLKRNNKFDTLPALKVQNLCKSYSNDQFAVRNVSFAVNAGECIALLGKNGAGKSTIFKMLSGQMQPSMGTITYADSEISYCPQTNTLDALLTVTECIVFYGRLRRVNDIPKLVANILDFFQLEPYRDVLVKNLSGGNRRKLTVATTCCGRTSVVLMDEPTSDMDPVTRAIVYRTVRILLDAQRAIVLTSHSVAEIDDICQGIAVLKDGQLLTCSSPESLNSQYGGFYTVCVYCEQEKVGKLEKDIRQRFSPAIHVQAYAHCIKFSIKIDGKHQDQIRESGIDVPPHLQELQEHATTSFTLANLFRSLDALCEEHGDNIRYAVNRCHLDTVLERILDCSEHGEMINGFPNTTAAVGHPSIGYVHNGYVETETET